MPCPSHIPGEECVIDVSEKCDEFPCGADECYAKKELEQPFPTAQRIEKPV